MALEAMACREARGGSFYELSMRSLRIVISTALAKPLSYI